MCYPVDALKNLPSSECKAVLLGIQVIVYFIISYRFFFFELKYKKEYQGDMFFHFFIVTPWVHDTVFHSDFSAEC